MCLIIAHLLANLWYVQFDKAGLQIEMEFKSFFFYKIKKAIILKTIAFSLYLLKVYYSKTINFLISDKPFE